MSNLRYSEFFDRINVDAFEEAIGFEPIEERNGNDVGFCLFPENHSHGDTTGKFGIHRELRVFNCYVCGGGSFLSLVMQLFGFDIEEATEWLYQFCEADMRTDSKFVDDFLIAFEDTQNRLDKMPYFNERVLDKYEDAPWWWCESRLIEPIIANQLSVKYSSEMRRPAPFKGKFVDEEDYYGPAILFPHFWNKQLVGWQCRWLDDERPEWVPKYTMSSDFPKETTLYNYDNARYINRLIYVVESVPSVLFLKSEGLEAVATFGSNVNDVQLRLLRRFTGDGVVLCPDNDPAGEKWTRSITKYLKNYVDVYALDPVKQQGGGLGSDISDVNSTEELLEQISTIHSVEEF